MDQTNRRIMSRASYNDGGGAGRFGLLPSLLEEFFQPSQGDARGISFPIDIDETEDAYQLKADLPGLEKSDIDVDLRENVLTVSAERKVENETESRPVWRERIVGKLSRTVHLPQQVDPDGVQATYSAGCLQVTLRKLAAASTRKISIG